MILLKSQWIYPSIVALLIEETTNQSELQEIELNVGFWREEKTGVPGEKAARAE